jgi:glycosyltransferase involved in cell wall biosynthesis
MANSVSVIIPCYNAAASIARCLDSVLSQTLPPSHVIVADDGSTDDSIGIVEGYGDAITILRQSNQGPAAARNAGFRVVTGEYVAMLDADDYWLPEFLKTCVGFLEAHPEAVAVSAGQQIKVWGHDECIRPAILAEDSPDKPRVPVVLKDFFDFWAAHNHITTGSNVIRKAVLDQAGVQRPELRICEDLEFWGYLATWGKWGFVPEVLFVCDGTAVEAAQGWLTKHRIRWQNCPTVEQWQERILPRLSAEDWPGFRVVRGRIAKIVAHNKILAGKDCEARGTVREYGAAFPTDKVGRLLKAASSLGPIGWKLCAIMLRNRERFKALRMALTAGRNTGTNASGRS